MNSLKLKNLRIVWGPPNSAVGVRREGVLGHFPNCAGASAGSGLALLIAHRHSIRGKPHHWRDGGSNTGISTGPAGGMCRPLEAREQAHRKPYLQGAGGRLQLQVALAWGVPAAERQVAGQVLGPHRLSIECRHLGLRKRGCLVKAWVPGVGRESWGCVCLSSRVARPDPLRLQFPLWGTPSPILSQWRLVWLACSSQLCGKHVSKTGHRVLGVG